MWMYVAEESLDCERRGKRFSYFEGVERGGSQINDLPYWILI
jgi:hypothetical protein